MSEFEHRIEEESALEDKASDFKVKTLKERAVIYQDIPVDLLGPDGLALLEQTKQELVEYKNTHKNKALAKYSPEQKIEAAVAYALCGTIHEVSVELNIPRDMLRDWAQQPWWPTAMALGRYYKNQHFHAQCKTLGEISLDRITDRVKAGKVSTATLLQVLKVVGDEGREVQKEISRTSQKETENDSLKSIREELQKLSAAQQAKDITKECTVTREVSGDDA